MLAPRASYTGVADLWTDCQTAPPASPTALWWEIGATIDDDAFVFIEIQVRSPADPPDACDRVAAVLDSMSIAPPSA